MYGLDPDNAGYTNWNVAGGIAVPSGDFSAVWLGTLLPADQEITVTIVTMPTVGAFRLYARIQNPHTAGHSQYELECDAGNSYFSKHVAGTRTFLSVVGSTFHAGDRMTLRCLGDQIIALKNGVEVGRRTDSSVAGSGYVGFLSQNDHTVAIDDLSTVIASTLVPAPVIQPYGLIFPGSDNYPGSDAYPAAVPTLVLSNAATRPLYLQEP